MAYVQIPNLPASAGVSGGELVEAVQAGSSVKLTTGQIASLSKPNGGAYAGNISFSNVLPDGANTARYLQTRFSDCLNVKDYGAIGDGVADDTNAFLSAIAATNTTAPEGTLLGKAIYIPSGTYLIKRINIIKSVVLFGDGSTSTKILCAPLVNSDVLNFNGVDGIEIIGITVDGNKAAQISAPVNSGNPVAFVSCSNVYMHDCVFTNALGNGMITFGGFNFHYEKCYFTDNNANGTYHTTTAVAIDNGTKNITGTNCVCSNNGFDGFCFDPGSDNCTLSACLSFLNLGCGYNVFGNNSGIFARNVTLVGCIAKRNSLEGFSVVASYNVTISGCQSIEDGQNGFPGRNHGFIVLGDFVGQGRLYNVTINNCLIFAPRGHGIFCDTTNGTTHANIIISDTLIYNVGQSNPGNYDGIHLTEVEDVLISDIFIKDADVPKKMRFGISTSADSTGVKIIGGTVESGTLGKYNVSNGDVFIAQEINDGEYSVFTKTEDKGISVYGAARPRITLTPTATSTSARFYARESSWYAAGIWNNIQWNTSWNLDNESYPGWDVSTNSDLDIFQVRRATSGTNPRNLTTLFTIRVNGTTENIAEIQNYPLPRYVTTPSPSGSIGRFYSRESSFFASGFTNNMNWSADWLLDDQLKSGWDVSTNSDLDIFQIRRAAPGPDPVTPVKIFQVEATAYANNATNLFVLHNDGSTTTLKRVNVGAADSAGTGFRALRVDN